MQGTQHRQAAFHGDLRALAEALDVVAGADTMGMTWVAAVPGGGGAAAPPAGTLSCQLRTLTSRQSQQLNISQCTRKAQSSLTVVTG